MDERELAFLALIDLLGFGPPPLDPDGTHKHQCACGVIWEHPNSRAGDEEAHTCPSCKTQLPHPWFHYNGEKEPCYVEEDGTPAKVPGVDNRKRRRKAAA